MERLRTGCSRLLLLVSPTKMRKLLQARTDAKDWEQIQHFDAS